MFACFCICSIGFQSVGESTTDFLSPVLLLLLAWVLFSLLTSSKLVFLPNSIPPPDACFSSLLSKQSQLANALLLAKVLQSGTNSCTTSGMLLPSLFQSCLKNGTFPSAECVIFHSRNGDRDINIATWTCMCLCVHSVRVCRRGVGWGLGGRY